MSDLFPNPNDLDWDEYKKQIKNGDYSNVPGYPNKWVSRDGQPPVPMCWYRNPKGVGELVHHNELYNCTRCEVLKGGYESVHPKYNGCYKCTEEPFEVRKITAEEAGQNCCSICTTAGGMVISNAAANWIDLCAEIPNFSCSDNCDCVGDCDPLKPCHACVAVPSPTGGNPFVYQKNLCQETLDGKAVSNHRCVDGACMCDQDYTECSKSTTLISGPTAATPDDAGCWCGCSLYEANPNDPCGGTIGTPDFNSSTCACECKLASRVVPCGEGETFVASLCKCEKDYEIDILNTNLIP
jgi:hypothetical protein